MSSGGGAGDAANAREQAREARVAKTQGAINRVFDNPQRAADINDFVNATREFYDRALNDKEDTAKRNLTFALARSGLSGGSVDVDRNALLDRAYQQGVLDNARNAMGAGAKLESADQAARARLIALATQGLDTTSAAQQSAAALQTDLQSGQAARNLDAVGGVFKTFNDVTTRMNQQEQQRRVNAMLTQQNLLPSSSGFNYGG